MSKETTLVLFKTDCVQNKLVGEILNRFEKEQSTITAAHLFWWEMHPSQTTEGYWPNQIKHMRDINE